MPRKKLLGIAVTAFLALGVLEAAPAAATRLETQLSGANEVPGPGDPDGSGVARVRVNVRAHRVCYAIVVQDINLPATGAHIHRGDAGVAGPIKVTLNNPTDVDASGTGVSFGCERGLRERLLRHIKQDPGSFYVNVHTEAFPDGAVRGQLG